MKNILLKIRLFALNYFTRYFETNHAVVAPAGFALIRSWEFQKTVDVPPTDELDTCEHWGWNHTCRKDGGMWNPDGSVVPPTDPRNYIEWNQRQVKLENGHLALVTDLNKDPSGTAVVAGEIATVEEFIFPLFVVVRMKVAPRGARYWDAGVMYSKAGWPPEFDIFEFEGSDSREFTSTLHALVGKENITAGHHKYRFKVDLSKDFHNYAVKWEKDSLSVYLDNILLWVYKGEHIPKEKMYFLFVHGIGQSFMPKMYTEDLLKEIFPMTSYIDFIEIYKKLQ